jgi:hypothetical protein
MADLAGKQKPEFIIDTGDNVRVLSWLFEMVLQVYFNGVDNVLDSRFEVRIFG